MNIIIFYFRFQTFTIKLITILLFSIHYLYYTIEIQVESSCIVDTFKLNTYRVH